MKNKALGNMPRAFFRLEPKDSPFGASSGKPRLLDVQLMVGRLPGALRVVAMREFAPGVLEGSVILDDGRRLERLASSETVTRERREMTARQRAMPKSGRRCQRGWACIKHAFVRIFIIHALLTSRGAGAPFEGGSCTILLQRVWSNN